MSAERAWCRNCGGLIYSKPPWFPSATGWGHADTLGGGICLRQPEGITTMGELLLAEPEPRTETVTVAGGVL